jgi:ATP-dependent DNA helicase RecQ
LIFEKISTAINAVKSQLDILKKYWGFDSFRGVQSEIVKSISDRKDTLGLMPTGGGKSITFQVPALVADGLCLVISPLIALMNDQVARLSELGIKAQAMHSGMSYQENMVTLDNAVYGAYKLLYVSPERIATDIFREKVKQMRISFITVDEAHCISQWGHDFRPSYLGIARLREILPGIPVLALTATATPEVVTDIQLQLAFVSGNVIQGTFTRNNLVYFVRESESKIADLAKIVESIRGTGIIYMRSRKKTRDIAEQLRREGVNADFYHAGLSFEKRKIRQLKWSNGETRIIVATNAFGMGIDKPDVRFVVHLDLPDSPEAYFQEAGRAGRDGKKAFAVLMVNRYDRTIAAQRLATAFPEIPEVKRIYSAMANFLQVPYGSGKGVAYDFNLFDFASAYKLNAVIAFNALKLLEKHGYIELTDEMNNPSRVYFLLGRDDLYKFQIKNSSFDGFIKLLLRSYTGLFSDYTVIDEDLLARRANITRDLVYQYLVVLNKSKVISYIPSRKTPLLIFSEERLEENMLLLSYEYIRERKTRYEQRLNAMLGYAFSAGECRNNLLLKYFGQAPENPCGQCDVCKSRLEDESTPERRKQITGLLLESLKLNPQYLGELQLNLEIKEQLMDQIVQELLAEEKIYYLDDGRLALR